ncbi:MAG: extensin family protein [Myxococcota bacterium]
MPQSAPAVAAGWAAPVFPMRNAPMPRLLLHAAVLFVAGGLAGWSGTRGLQGCMAAPRVQEAATMSASRPRAEPSGSAPEPGGEPAAAGEAAAERESASSEEASSEDASAPAPVLALPDSVPQGRAIAGLDPDDCYGLLDELDVAYDRRAEAVIEAREAVGAPLLLEGAAGGVTFEHVGRSASHEVTDCRLVVALLRWAVLLRAAGITKVEHMSIYRADATVDGTKQRSGHAVALAIDAARFEREDGTALDVLEDWSDKERGAEPCAEREDEPEPQALLRSLVCDAVEQELFQVVITPHHNRAHRNHVHLELVPGVDWSYIR